jgi:hypothetical protein
MQIWFVFTLCVVFRFIQLHMESTFVLSPTNNVLFCKSSLPVPFVLWLCLYLAWNAESSLYCFHPFPRPFKANLRDSTLKCATMLTSPNPVIICFSTLYNLYQLGGAKNGWSCREGMGGCGLDSSGLGYDPRAGCYEHDNEPVNFIKGSLAQGATPGSNLGRYTGYLDWNLSLFFLVPPVKWEDDLKLGQDRILPQPFQLFIVRVFFLFWLWDYRHCGHSWPIVPASGDNEDDCGEHDGM